MTELRCITYLSPSLPLEMFDVLAATLRERLGVPVSLRAETELSGPLPGADPFSAGQADLGFMCSPSYAWLTARSEPVIDLLPVALLPNDPRCEGRPVFFSDLVVRDSSPASDLRDMRGATWAYNDPCSQSGYFSVLRRLEELSEDATAFFSRRMAAGSHLQAMLQIARGSADFASIDSNVLRLQWEALAELRILETLGPYPIQPIVVRRDVPESQQDEIAAALREDLGDALLPFGFLGVGPVTPEHYAGECRALRRLEPGGPR